MTARIPVSRGDTFGRLTALRFLGMRAQQQEWRLRCSCGVRVRRAIADLRAAIKKGREPMCPTCAKKAGVAAMNKAKRAKKAAAKAQWSKRLKEAALRGQWRSMLDRVLTGEITL